MTIPAINASLMTRPLSGGAFSGSSLGILEGISFLGEGVGDVVEEVEFAGGGGSNLGTEVCMGSGGSMGAYVFKNSSSFNNLSTDHRSFGILCPRRFSKFLKEVSRDCRFRSLSGPA